MPRPGNETMETESAYAGSKEALTTGIGMILNFTQGGITPVP